MVQLMKVANKINDCFRDCHFKELMKAVNNNSTDLVTVTLKVYYAGL